MITHVSFSLRKIACSRCANRGVSFRILAVQCAWAESQWHKCHAIPRWYHLGSSGNRILKHFLIILYLPFMFNDVESSRRNQSPEDNEYSASAKLSNLLPMLFIGVWRQIQRWLEWMCYVAFNLLIIRCSFFEIDAFCNPTTLKNTPGLLQFKLDFNFSSFLQTASCIY